MKFSYSKVDTFKTCPRKFFYRYVEGLKTYPDYDPANPLVIGTALHTGIEQGIETALNAYYGYYPVIDDKHIEEAMKLAYVVENAREVLPVGEHETRIKTTEEGIDFIGFMDLLVPVGSNEYDLYDFKYSNGIERYMESGQLHVYKHYFEIANPGKKIGKMYFVFAPKVQIRLKKTETLEDFRIRLGKELATKSVRVLEVAYNEEKVKEFKNTIETINRTTDYTTNKSKLCDWCEYQRFCESDETDDSEIDWVKTFNETLDNGVDIMQLPKNERRAISSVDKKRIWIYGAPFSGKTYLANAFPDPLMLNTDGNVKFIDAPCIHLKDSVTMDGRIPKRTFAWEVFKDAITELEKKDNSFKTIVVDLVEDTYESCRQYMFDKLGIMHESDSGYGKGWDMVKTEFLTVIKRLMATDYDNIVLISHEDTSKDLTKKSGDKITSIKPNIGDKPALKIAGMVDLVARVINNGGVRTLSFKNNEFIFGGGRLGVASKDIPCEYGALCKVYEHANAGKTSARPTSATPPIADDVQNEAPETAVSEPIMAETPETPKRRRVRKTITEE